MRVMNPELDLTMTRVIRAPRALVWRAWSEPESFAQWWVPAPAKCRVAAMEMRAGGALVTEISEDGRAFVPHMNACFLHVTDGERIVFTDTLTGGWRPSDQPFMTAIISLADRPEGTEYAAYVMHRAAPTATGMSSWAFTMAGARSPRSSRRWSRHKLEREPEHENGFRYRSQAGAGWRSHARRRPARQQPGTRGGRQG